MSTQQIVGGSVADPPKHCEQCGQRLTASRFCAGCGNETFLIGEVEHDSPSEPALHSHAADQRRGQGSDGHTTAAGRHDASASAKSPSNRKTLLIAVAALAILAVAGATAAFVLTTSKEGNDDGLSYRRQLAATFGPVLGANREVSLEMSRLSGTKPTDASAAVRRARQATTIATGAVGAFTVPAGSEQLARDTRQVLDREDAYLAAVAAVLSDPSSPTRSQLQTLSSNLTSALSAAGPTIAGTSQTVSGADRLGAWAPRASRTLKRRAARRGSTQRPSSTRGSSPAGNPFASGRSCGGGLYAGPSTSCEFAQNVQEAYEDAPGATASVRVFSPVTGATYTMSCRPSGSGVTCSGGNDASVAF